MSAVGLAWDLLARDQASPTFLRVASAAERAALATSKSQRSVENWTAASARTGAKLTKGITLPLLGLAAVSVDQAAKYQKSLNTIAVATDQSASSMKLAQTQLIAISNRTGTSTSQLSEALYTAAKSGQPMAKALRTVEAAAQGAKAENADLGTVSNALTSIMASYGSKLGDPVKAMNMLVRGSGLAKTTLQDFADSLSNVVPIASSLGIGFDQVAGAIDTMTQHGETAQRATDNLSNLITNLAGQNNVASQSLQQLGVNTIDLSSKLGKRGLTGSLDVVLDSVAKNSKGGLVVTSAFKKAATATASLQTEISAMSPALAKQSKGFADGTVGYKDYLAYAKSLGGQQYNMARQFIGTTSTAQGFNNQLKSGNSTVRTTASTLQKALGGVTGMRTALMLSGESAKTFKGATAAVGEAAQASGKQVLGFAQTQQTAAYKTAAAKVQLQNVSIQLGTVLLPALVKLAETGTKAVGWIDGLSHSQKTVGLWAVGILASIGPILSIGARLSLVGVSMTRFTTGIVNQAARFSSGLALNAGAAATAMGRLNAGIGGAAIGASIGMLTRNSSAGVKAIGALGSAAAGAAIGFGAAGPMGAAIGAGVGLLSNLAAGFKGASNAAKSNVSGIDSFTSAIERDNLALGQNVKALVATDLNKKYGDTGKTTFNLASKLGIDPKTLTDAVTGVKSARDKVNAILSANSAESLGIRVSRGVPKANAQAAKVLGVNVGSTLTGKQVDTLRRYAGAANDVANAIGAETGQTKAATKAAKDYAAATSTAGKNDTARNASLKAITREQTAASTALAGLNKQVGVHGTSLSATTPTGKADADGRSNIAMLSDVLGKYRAIEQAQVLAGVSTDKASAAFNSSTAALRRQATAAGLSGSGVDALIKKYRMAPKQVITNMLANIGKATASASQLQSVINSVRQNRIPGLDANSAQALAVINALQARIDALTGKTITVTTVLNQVNGQNKVADVRASTGKATGGIIRGPGGPREDRAGVYALSNGEAVIPTRGVEKHRPLVEFLIAEGRGLARGGVIGTTSATAVYKVGGGWGFQGQYYGGKTGHKDANNARADYINGQRAAALYHSPEARGQVATDRNSYLAGIATGDVDSVRSAYTSLFTDAKAAGASRAELVKLSTAERKVIADLQKRATITDQVSKATDYLTDLQSKAADLRSSVSGAVTGTFSVATAGQPFSDRAASADSILAELTADANKAAAYGTLLQTLGKEGLNRTLLQQLAEAGPSAFAQAKALAGATPAKLASINAQYSRLTTAGNTAGSYVSGLLYGAKIDVAKALLNGYDPKKNPAMGKAVTALATSLFGAGRVSGVGLTKGLLGQRKAAGAAATVLGNQVRDSLKKSLGIHSPSRVTRELGQHTGIGFALGLQDTVAWVTAASGMVGAAGVPSPAPPSGQGGGGNTYVTNHEWNITEVDNGMEVHHKVMRRLALAGP